MSEVPELAGLAAAAGRSNTRLQAVVPEGDGERRVARYTWDPDRGRYDGIEVVGGDVAAVAGRLIAGEVPSAARPVDGPELLVCGHGRRDRCCGSIGTSLQQALEARGLPGGCRLRRTSHTGGHRFAPTGIVLPAGTWWGYLDEQAVISILAREDAPGVHAHRYRGCSGLGDRAVQALERAVLEKVGWSLLDWPRRGLELDGDRVGLRAVTPDGQTRYWEGRVEVTRMLPVPKCGAPLAGDEKQEPELRVSEMEELPGPPS